MKKKDNFDGYFKILIIGESGVGKTCICLRFTEDIFEDKHIATIGIDFKIKSISIGNKLIKLQIWDTAGQERFRVITKTYYKGAHGVILAYDVTNKNSFEQIEDWIKQIEENAQKGICRVLVGNKCDKTKERVISYQQGNELATKYNMRFFEASAKTGENIIETFKYLASELTAQIIGNGNYQDEDEDDSNYEKPSAKKSIKLSRVDSETEKKKKKCC